MKLLHTADWHLGRTLNGFSLLEEQRFAFNQILEIAKEYKVDGIVIAGDLYDRSVAPVEAVTTFNGMLKQLVIHTGIPVYAISGNHDGAKRLSFGHDFFKNLNFHLHTTINDALMPIETEDAQLFLLPFLDPMDVRVYYGQVVGEDAETVASYGQIGDGIKRIIADMKAQFNPNKCQILVTHFAVSKKGDDEGVKLKENMHSETFSTVGGLAQVTSDLFNGFDYVALGHIHTHKASPTERIAYSGSPVIFNTKEAKLKQPKGVYIVDIARNNIQKTFIPLKVQKALVVIEQPFKTVISPEFYEQHPCKKAWFSFQLTDYNRKEMAGINVRARLEKIYGTDIVELTFKEQGDTNNNLVIDAKPQILKTLPEGVVADFYESTTQTKLTDYQRDVVSNIIQNIRKEVG